MNFDDQEEKGREPAIHIEGNKLRLVAPLTREAQEHAKFLLLNEVVY